MVRWLLSIITGISGLKVFMGGGLMIILGITVYNLVVDIIEEVLNFVLAQVNGVSVGNVVQPSITGFAAWALTGLKFPECISVITSMIVLRFVLRKIPFLRW